MRSHTTAFKQNISNIGRQFDSIITYELNNETIELGSEDLNSVTPHYKGDILKSVMKQLDVDSNVDIPIGTVINYQFGVDVNGSYEYLDYGNYIVNKSERQEDTNSYKLTCYDKVLYSMIDYEQMNITYPITIRNYINAICTHLGLTFANSSDTFTNYDKLIPSELFLNSEGGSLGYTFRDVLDQLAQVTASTICLNNDDELEIRYITDTEDTIDEDFFKNVNVEFGQKYGPVNSVVLSRSAGSDSIYQQDDESIELNGLCELKIEDNQIMNGNDRDEYLTNIFTRLDGLEYYINDYASTGIMYYELCDRYTAHIGENDYSCVMLNDEALVTQGLQENIHTNMPTTSETEYKYADKTDKKINQAYLIVDKVNGEITGLVSKTNQLDTTINNNYQEIMTKFDGYAPQQSVVDLQTSVQQIQTDTYTRTQIDTMLVDGTVKKVQTTSATYDENGMTYEKSNSNTKTTINEVGVQVKDSNTNNTILFAGYVDSNNTQYSGYQGQSIVATDNIIVDNYLVVGSHSRFEDYETGTGCFFIG